MADTRNSGAYEFAPDHEPEIPLEERGEPAAPAKPRKPLEAVPDRICPHCGFNIFGKTRGGRCPQCAAPLEHAAQDLLQFSSPAWVRTMATGFIMLALAIATHMLAAALRFTSPPIIGALLHLAAASLLLISILTATRVESAIGGKALIGTTAARWLALAAAVLWLVLLLLILGIGHRTGEVMKWLTVLALACHALIAIAFGLYTRALAQRIPDDDLANHSLNLSWLVALVCIALMAIQVLDLTTRVHLMFFFCSFPMIAGFVAILLWGMVTLLRTAIALRASAIAGEDIAAHRSQWNQKG
jgi:hypothetical protein